MMKLPFHNVPSFAAAPVIGQTLLVAVVMLAALLAPPASGSILLVPLHGQGGAVLQDALKHGARLEGAGPIAGTFVVRADRDQLLSAMLHSGVLMLAARPLLCSEPEGAGR